MDATDSPFVDTQLSTPIASGVKTVFQGQVFPERSSVLQNVYLGVSIELVETAPLNRCPVVMIRRYRIRNECLLSIAVQGWSTCVVDN